MSKPKVTEVRAQYADKSAAEIRSDIARREETLANEQRYLAENVLKLAALTPDDKRYIYTLKDLTDSLKMSAGDIEYDSALLELLRPMLAARLLFEISTYNYKQFIKDNQAGLQPLIDAVAKLEAEADWEDFTKAQIHQAHTLMFEETICLLMGRMTRIDTCAIQYGNKGFDGWFHGDEDIRIQTTGVGGYNIVRFHYRTNVYL